MKCLKELTVCRIIDIGFAIFFLLGAAMAGLNWYVVEHSTMNAIVHACLQVVSLGLIGFNLYAIWNFYIKKYFFKK